MNSRSIWGLALLAVIALCWGHGAALAQNGSKNLPRWPQSPDPAPLMTADYLDLSLELHQGRVRVLSLRQGSFTKGPTRLKRYSGRFAVRLYSHGLLLDVVRFNFPLTGGAGERGSRANQALGKSLARGVKARITVRVPFDKCINRVHVKDLQSKQILEVKLGRLAPPPPFPSTKNLRLSSFGTRKPDSARKKPQKTRKKGPKKRK